MGCFQYIKGTKKKANHNLSMLSWKTYAVVSNTSKVLKRKQITTKFVPYIQEKYVVSNTSKVLKRKQITTTCSTNSLFCCCFQYIKGTKKKINHNDKL